jgi:hypothetical protein
MLITYRILTEIMIYIDNVIFNLKIGNFMPVSDIYEGISNEKVCCCFTVRFYEATRWFSFLHSLCLSTFQRNLLFAP